MNKTDIERLQVAQNKAAHLNCPFHTSVKKMHSALSWLTVQNKFNYNLLLFLKKIIMSRTPVALYKNIVFVHETHSYPTRRASSDLVVDRFRTNHLQKSVLHRASVLWNNLPRNLRDCTKLGVFKLSIRGLMNGR